MRSVCTKERSNNYKCLPEEAVKACNVETIGNYVEGYYLHIRKHCGAMPRRTYEAFAHHTITLTHHLAVQLP